MSEVRVDMGPVVRAVDRVNSNVIQVGQDVGLVINTVDNVNNQVTFINDEVKKLAKEFYDFVQQQVLVARLTQAKIDIVAIRNELDRKFGHYNTVRRHITGILQATDLEIIRGSTITTVTEELMLDTPNYWLSPCLVAISAWINDQPEIAEKALREAIKRNDEKASLLFALVCRRADRKNVCLKWVQRFLGNQDPESLDRKSIIILDAFASGLLGADSEGVVSRQINEWLDHLTMKPGFTEQQTKQWSEAIILKRKLYEGHNYIYLPKYSKTWSILKDIMEGAMLHNIILEYFQNIFNQSVSTDSLKAQLDEVLDSLVTEFDDDEIPLRKQEKLEQFVIDFKGDEKRALSNMKIEETAFETHKDFTQLLTDAAMKPESSGASVSTQKFALALSKEWITHAYNDVIAKNRMNIPHEIEINLNDFNDITTDGQNEHELIDRFNRYIDTEKKRRLDNVSLSGFDNFCLWGGIALAIIGIIMMSTGSPFIGLGFSIWGVAWIIRHFSKKKSIKSTRDLIESNWENQRNEGTQIIRALLAEVVDFRNEFKTKDNDSQKVIDFLDTISPDQYVKKLSESSRRIKPNS